ncbi:hypothetical protein SVIOM342S_02644 [Streptomyces violaceorubidus]
MPLYEVREGLRESHRSEEELREDLAGATLRWGAAFERVMLLGGDEAIESGHELNVVLAEIDWQATGRIEGSLEEWRERHRAGVPRHQRLPRGRQGRSRHPGRRHREEHRSAICWSRPHAGRPPGTDGQAASSTRARRHGSAPVPPLVGTGAKPCRRRFRVRYRTGSSGTGHRKSDREHAASWGGSPSAEPLTCPGTAGPPTANGDPPPEVAPEEVPEPEPAVAAGQPYRVSFPVRTSRCGGSKEWRP